MMVSYDIVPHRLHRTDR